MGVQRLSKILVVAVVAALLSGCVAGPSPQPTPAPTFTSDAEAFAAAEATYRAYVDALNQVDLADPETFEAVYAWTTGEANAEERTNLSRMHAENWQVSGRTEILTVSREGAEPTVIVVCVDVSGVSVVDAAGATQVSPERPNQYALAITLVPGKTPTGYRISVSEAVDPTRCG